MFPLEVSQTEDDVVGVGDGDAQALQEPGQEVGPLTEGRLLGRVVGGEREADVNLQRRKMEVVEEVALALNGKRKKKIN